MTGSFISALGGLRAHQDWIDVIGNNLANANTPGFKGSRALFSDLLSVTKRPGTGPGGSVGGTNPLQVGLGVQLSSVDRMMQQGALNVTGRTFDLALLGEGYFALDGGSQTLFSRVGTFGLDASGSMVDLRSGYRVLDTSGQSFSIDSNAVVPPSVTSQIGFSGNLPAEVTGPLAEVLTSASSFAEGTEAQVTTANAGPFVVPTGETWTMELVVNGGAPQQISLAAGSYSAAALADEINLQSEDLVATAASGAVTLTSSRSGLDSTIKVDAGSAGKDLKGLLGLGDFVQGTETVATAATDLSDLASNLADYQVGDAIELSGTDVDGSPVIASFTYGVDGTTVGELVSFLDSQYGQSTIAFNATTGEISVDSDTTGEAELSLVLSDGASQTGASEWATHFFSITTNGTGPDTVTTSIEVFDAAGTPHTLTAEFVRQDDGTWNLESNIDETEGSVLSGPVTGVSFNENGSILTPTSIDLQVQFGSLSPQTITLDLGQSGQFSGLTQFGNPASAVADSQDGFGAGELASLQVNNRGEVEGFYTNGQIDVLGNFGIANFTNQAGLSEVGDSYFRESANSGTRTLGAGTFAGAGEVVGGAIENSNVDTATEFVHLIEAQRGFQANARVITVMDELLAEVANII